MPEDETKFFVGAPESSSDAPDTHDTPGTPQERGVAQFIQHIFNHRFLGYRFLGSVVVICIVLWFFDLTIVSNVSFLVAGLCISLLLIRFGARIAASEHVGRALNAIWLPVVVVAIATYLLFFNDQGRELGVGLMGFDVTKLIALPLTLVYWALNNWLCARIGLYREYPEPESGQHLLFWGPRFLGVCAHLLAATSLSFAAWNQPELLDKTRWWAVLSAPIAIALATLLVWLFDYAQVSERSEAHGKPFPRLLTSIVGILESLLLLHTYDEWQNDRIPDGLFFGTLSIVASAIIFLYAVSRLRCARPLGKNADPERRNKETQKEQSGISRWSGALGAITLLGIVIIWITPMWVGRTFGSLIVACFAFGAVIALANLFDLAAEALSRYANRSNFRVTRRAVWGVFLCLLAFPIVATSFARPFHRVRLCDKDCTAAPTLQEGWAAVASPADRQTVREAAVTWYKQAAPVYHSIYPDRPVPLFIVATAGGGIRAAYWTATVLEQLERDLGPAALKEQFGDKAPGKGLLRHLLFAISGVSGGSAGAAAYAAAIHNQVNDKDVVPTRYLTQDYLAPGLASLIFIDTPSNFLPDFGQISRGEALELGFEYGSRVGDEDAGLLSHKFLSFFPTAGASALHWRPILLLNATHQETGRRMITGHVKIERDIFPDSYDALQVLGADVRLSTAVHNSARFTYVSPAGNLLNAAPNPKDQHNRGYVIDGGYFENFGAQTALEIARQAMEAIDPTNENKVKLVVLQISSDPSLTEDRTLVRIRQDEKCSVTTLTGTPNPATGQSPQSNGTTAEDPANYLRIIDPAGWWDTNEGEGYVLSPQNELSAPLVGIMSVRLSHGTIAAAELAAAICAHNSENIKKALTMATSRATTADKSSAKTATSANGNAARFAHIAMCEKSKTGPNAVIPPLGWVLSEATRARFKGILNDCGNKKELTDLEKALGAPAGTASVTRQ